MGYATKSTAESSHSVCRIFQHTQTSSCGRGDDVAVDDDDAVDVVDVVDDDDDDDDDSGFVMLMVVYGY